MDKQKEATTQETSELTVTQKPKTIQLPSLQELYSDKEATAKQSELNILLNASPKPEWIKSHPFVKDLKYIPVERIEYLLTMIYGKWRVEVKEVKLLANSIIVSVRLFVRDPLNQTEWDYQDGIGAAPIQTAKGKSPIDFDSMSSNAIQIGAPAAESYALKDAAEKLGRIFGKDLNRKDTTAYVDRLHASIAMLNKLTVVEQIEATKSEEELKKLWFALSQAERDDADILAAKEAQKKQFPTPTKSVNKSSNENTPSRPKKSSVARATQDESNGNRAQKNSK